VSVAGPGLDAATAEAEAVAALHTGSRLLLPTEATSPSFLGLASGAKVVHLACHGTLRSDSPTFSAFRMTDGPLTVHDLESLSEPAHLWILAACDLGSPGRLAGPDLEGVLAALLAGGAGGVVAAVVPIPDAATTPLMVDLHRGLADGDSLAGALRTARLAADPNDPAAFVTATAFGCYGGG
jgi:CHAT domain-containing protein